MEGEAEINYNHLYPTLESSSNYWLQLASIDSLLTTTSQNYESLCHPNGIVHHAPQLNKTLNPNAGVQRVNSNKRSSEGKKRAREKEKEKETWYKGPWTSSEDRKLITLVDLLGKDWASVSEFMAGRIGKQCRERWHNNLNPNIMKSIVWTDEEEVKIIEGHQRFGNKWSEIAKGIPGRSENAVKNHWNSIKRKQNSIRKIERPAKIRHLYQPNILENYIKNKFYCKNKSSNSDSDSSAAGDVPTLSVDDYDMDEIPFFTFEIADIMQDLYDDGGN